MGLLTSLEGSKHSVPRTSNLIMDGTDHNFDIAMALGTNAIVIVGMCRSGTSSVAGALAEWGVSFGKSEQLYAADAHNETGYWEHKYVNAANRKFHQSLNLRSLDSEPIPEDWLDRPMSNTFTNGMVNVLRTHFDGLPDWGWKDPQASTLIPYVREVYQRLSIEPKLIICVRNPLNVARSQAKRQGSPERQTIGAWLLNTLAALKDSKDISRRVVLYESLLADPIAALKPIAEMIGLHPTENQVDAVLKHVNPSLSHGTSLESDLSGYPSIVSRTYELCRSVSDAPETLDTEQFHEELNQLWSEWLTWHDLLERSEMGEVNFSLSWERRGEIQVQDSTYRPNKHWQTVRCTSKALPGSRVSLVVYPLPAIIWVRKAVWRQGESEMPVQLLPGRHGQLDSHEGLQRIWVFHGTEQAAVQSPVAKGSFELELEILVETSSLITGMTVQDLSQRLK